MGEKARASGPLTDAHEATIRTTLADQTTGLTALRAKIQAATTPEAVAESCRLVVPDYRVFVLTRPKVNLTIGADTLATGVPGAVLVLLPAGYPANAAVVTANRTTLTEARGKLKAAVQDAKDARGLLKS